MWDGRVCNINPDRFVFLDEVGVNTSMTRLYGRAPRGERLIDRVPQVGWKMTTLLASMRQGEVFAPVVFEGATDEAVFVTYVEEVLVPKLRPGDIVVMDNLSAHKVGAVARRIRKAGAGCWYLPPYSPDKNPIEKIWAKIKGYLRKAKARIKDDLYKAIGAALDAVTAQECQNCFAHCGYPATFECNAL